MATSTPLSPAQREPELLGQTVVVVGGSAGIGLETARLARAEGAEVVLTARNPDRLHQAGLELGASIAAFDATDFDRLEKFFDALSTQIDHVLVTGPGPYYAPLAEFDLEAALREQLGGQSLAGRDAAFSWAALVAAARRRASISCRHSQLRFPP
jgi:NAD(P)-dependent dehydrogenase (short-subunit alcohol dehydrogenase family)